MNAKLPSMKHVRQKQLYRHGSLFLFLFVYHSRSRALSPHLPFLCGGGGGGGGGAMVFRKVSHQVPVPRTAEGTVAPRNSMQH